jgi:hypothetical protein
MMQIEKSGATLSGTAEDLEQLCAQFDQQHYLRFPKLFEPALLHFVQLQIEQGEFYERIHEGIGSNKELCMTHNRASALLLFLLNGEKLFQIIEEITRCGRIGCFEGRVYRVTPGHGHHDSWHDDMVEHRLVAMSINLSTEVYTGGVLQIRDRKSGKIVCEVANVGIGDAIIFSLSHGLQHRITEVDGTASKTAFAGWFRAKPHFLSLIKGQPEPAREPHPHAAFGDL